MSIVDFSDGFAGLSSTEAAARLRQAGPNEVTREEVASPIYLFVRQFKNPVIWLLGSACVLEVILAEFVEAIAIGVIIAMNALVGFLQEVRAERAVTALRAMTAPRARVLRDGRPVVLPAVEVVPGDTLLLEAGDVVAADAKLFVANSLVANEAMLTGESTPAQKSTSPSTASTPLAERQDSVFLGTSVVAGTGHAIVTATGMRTEIGKIAHLLTTAQVEAPPLQTRLARVSRVLIYICVSVVCVVAAIGLGRGLPFGEVLLSAVSLAVAAVPEGLPAVVTIALAIGVQRMVSRNVLVRRLPAIEALGSASVICTDKTGTLTTGVMKVRELWGTDDNELVYAACSCCDAELDAQDGGIGDPTEVAILLRGRELGVLRKEIEQRNPRVSTQPFDSERKRMSIRRANGCLYVKGALETTLSQCTSGLEGSREANQRMAERGLRVLAVAVGDGAREENLRLLGLIGIADPPRAEAIEAVSAARAAGIRTVMITGDHPVTARAIAQELGILGSEENGDDIVHARATPQDKLEIVRRWKARGHVVAMTGDGVNDAPALREAHVGVAMGKTGTEVTREAAAIILTDDNFASIVAGIREGRGIFENIRKTIVFLLSGNAGELAVMLGAALIGLPVPLLPLHLLWVNLVTDGLPALALVMDPVAPDAMTTPPRKPDEPMLARPQWVLIGWTGLLQAGVSLSVFAWALQARGLTQARDLAFSTLVFGELFRAFAARSSNRLFLEVGIFANLRLLLVVVVSVGIQVGLHHIPIAQELLDIGQLSLTDCGLALGLGMIPVTVLELAKLYNRAMPLLSRYTR